MNSWAEQNAIVQELIATLDAVEIVAPTATGLERARQLAAQAISLQPDPIPEQPELFE